MRKWALFLILCLAGTGCDQFTWFQSEGGVKKKLQGTWKRVFIGDPPPNGHPAEFWAFDGGSLSIYHEINSTTFDTIDVGSYDINTSLFSAHVKISDMTDTTYHDLDDNQRPYDYNENWTIIDLDKHILYMVADINAGLIQREFVKKD